MLIALAGGGVFLLDRADSQARDTTRKHHLEDLETALFFAREKNGTYPPYQQPTWCGLLNDPANELVHKQVEQALRDQNAKYANQAKPFPTDPSALQKGWDYFYWKRSPAIFELYAVLEANDNNDRNTFLCKNAPGLYFDYGLSSVLREDRHTSRL